MVSLVKRYGIDGAFMALTFWLAIDKTLLENVYGFVDRIIILLWLFFALIIGLKETHSCCIDYIASISKRRVVMTTTTTVCALSFAVAVVYMFGG